MSEPLAALLSAKAVRERCHELLNLADVEGLEHFRVDRSRMDDVASLVIATTRARYPDLKVPFHSRWRHFEVDGVSRWPEISDPIAFAGPQEAGRVAFELAIVSVLLDAGAGPEWRYRDVRGQTWSRSEGLAMASFDAFASGVFGSGGKAVADADGLQSVRLQTLAKAFQVSDNNPLVGLEGRIALMHALGKAVAEQSDYFVGGRLGGLFDYCVNRDEALSADQLLGIVLRSMGRIWPGRIERGGLNLGDVWEHPKLRRDDESNGLVPLHKLSQWLTYSLFEPLAWGGKPVRELDGMTGLAEYRNGGLVLDTGLLVPRSDEVWRKVFQPGDLCVVEWRALTVALLDEIAVMVRGRLGLDETALPLASVLEGGTWAAGRETARGARDGLPPLAVASDGTLF